MYLHATAFLVVILLGTAVARRHFLDCPGNKPGFLELFVLKCCSNDPSLPNDCECFSIQQKSGFTNTHWKLPKCPKQMDVRFLLYTRNNTDVPDIVKVGDDSIGRSHFRNGMPVVFITHGYTDKAPIKWSCHMKDTLLYKEDVNVILVDWEKGAKVSGITFYSRAAANIRTVGAVVAKLLTVLNTDHDMAYEDVHLIGHSLGAHASGMAGKEVKRLTGKKIGRISGLDPAGPAFEDVKPHVRLDKTDAHFVDVIHTDAEPLGKSGFGIRKNIGSVDFWPNGGVHQPDCPPEVSIFSLLDVEEGQIVGICSHMIVLDYFTDSINGTCFNTSGGCIMGYHASPQYCSGMIYLETINHTYTYNVTFSGSDSLQRNTYIVIVLLLISILSSNFIFASGMSFFSSV